MESRQLLDIIRIRITCSITRLSLFIYQFYILIVAGIDGSGKNPYITSFKKNIVSSLQLTPNPRK